MAEPEASAACPVGSFGQHLPPYAVCRYPRGACFTYWACTKDTFVWHSDNGMADGCCGADEPATSTSCPTTGVTCTYGGDLVTCDAMGWTVSALPGTGGAAGTTGGAGMGASGAAGGGG